MGQRELVFLIVDGKVKIMADWLSEELIEALEALLGNGELNLLGPVGLCG